MWGIELQRQGEISLSRQIYQTLRDYIIDGQIKQGEALPSTRELAKQLTVSRNTVSEAYEMLLAEGFVISRQGSPTRVAEGLSLEKTPFVKRSKETRPHPQSFRADFKTGQPDLRYFPRYLWQQLFVKTFEKMPLNQLGYSGPEGLLPLREEIAAWLFRSKGLTVSSQDIFITAGATQALHLLADLLSTDGREMLIEDPCHIGMLRALQGKGYSMRPVPVDALGLQTDYLEGKGAGAIYVTPSHQFPLGGILPATRRAELIRFARDNNLYIVEDDYDSEFRYCGASVSPLYAMDPQRVIYVGTFSKILFPALRIGYVVLPLKLHSQWRYLRIHADVQNPPFEQAALAEYLHTRKLDRHVQQMRRLYGQRRQVLLQTLEETFVKVWHPWGDAAGLHLALEFPGLRFDSEFAQRAQNYGIRVTPVEYHSICKGKHLDKLLIGYGHLEPDEIRKGILLLHDFMKENS
ncbi:MocR-like pyridoxine biosynthesis transcription factor PdxR [Desulfosporosinus fructosivorans]